MKYSVELLNEFFNPQNVGVIKGASGKGKIVCSKDREIMKIYIQVENDKIVDAKFQTFGCPAAIASTSVATRLMIGKTLEEASSITEKDILKELNGVPEEKEHCVKIAEKTIKDAIKNYYKKSSGDNSDLDDDE